MTLPRFVVVVFVVVLATAHARSLCNGFLLLVISRLVLSMSMNEWNEWIKKGYMELVVLSEYLLRPSLPPPFLCCLCLFNTLPPPYFDTFDTKTDHDDDHHDDSQVSKCKEDLDHHSVFSAERLIRYEDQLLSHAI